MKRVTYLINDKDLKKDKNKKPFYIYYTLNEDKGEITYSIEDENNNDISINELNGFENQYINICFKAFKNNEQIPKQYENIIKILDKPRIIIPKINVRYELFKDYAKEKNIQINNIEYLKFIDKMSIKYQDIYDKNPLSSPKDFDELIKYEVLSVIARKESKESIGIGTIYSSSRMKNLLKKYSISEETDNSMFYRINNVWDFENREKVIEKYKDMLINLPDMYKNKYYDILKFNDKDSITENYGIIRYKKDILENIEKIESINSKIKIFIYWTDENDKAAFEEKSIYTLDKANELAKKSKENLLELRDKMNMQYITNDIKFSVIIDDGKKFIITKPGDFLIGCNQVENFTELMEKYFGKDFIEDIELSNNRINYETENNEEEESSL